jgi:signal transduction histidine kinase
MSHELRSPLNAILGFAQLMVSDSPPPTPSLAEVMLECQGMVESSAIRNGDNDVNAGGITSKSDFLSGFGAVYHSSSFGSWSRMCSSGKRARPLLDRRLLAGVIPPTIDNGLVRWRARTAPPNLRCVSSLRESTIAASL